MMDSAINAGESKAPIGRGQKQLSLRVDLPHHELISRLQEWVTRQAEETWSRSVQTSKQQSGNLQTYHIFNIQSTLRTFTVTRS